MRGFVDTYYEFGRTILKLTLPNNEKLSWKKGIKLESFNLWVRIDISLRAENALQQMIKHGKIHLIWSIWQHMRYFYFQFKEKMLYQIGEEIMADNLFFFIELQMVCIKRNSPMWLRELVRTAEVCPCTI